MGGKCTFLKSFLPGCQSGRTPQIVHCAQFEQSGHSGRDACLKSATVADLVFAKEFEDFPLKLATVANLGPNWQLMPI